MHFAAVAYVGESTAEPLRYLSTVKIVPFDAFSITPKIMISFYVAWTLKKWILQK